MKKLKVFILLVSVFFPGLFAQGPVTAVIKSPVEFELRNSTLGGFYESYNSVPAATDIDGDGCVDLLLGKDNGKIVRYEQDSLYSETYTLRTSNFNSIDVVYESNPAITDLDGDGLLDLLIGDGDGYINHYEQSGVNSASFTYRTDQLDGMRPGPMAKPCVYDIDNDGKLDLFIGVEAGTIAHYEQDAVNSLTFVQHTLFLLPVGYRRASPSIADIDYDGLLDLLIGDQDGNIAHYIQDSLYANTFTLSDEHYMSIDVGDYATPDFADLDGDCLLDLLIGENFGNVNYYEQAEIESIDFGVVSSEYSEPVMYTVNSNDLTDDLIIESDNSVFQVSLNEYSGYQDSLVITPVNGKITANVYVRFSPVSDDNFTGTLTHSSAGMTANQIAVTGEGYGIPVPAAAVIKLPVEYVQKSTEFNSINTGSDSAPAIIDIDNDFLLDLVIGNADGYLLHYEQDSINSETFSRNYSSLDSTQTSTLTKPCFTDVDGDGLIDMLVGKSGGWIARYEQVSPESDEFAEVSQNFSGLDVGNNSAPTIADIDGDGLLDLLSGKGNGTISHYKQDAPDSWSFTWQTNEFNSIDIGDNSVPTLTDLDGDGLFDLVIGKVGGYIAHYEQHETNSLVFDHVADRLVPQDLGAEATPVFCDIDGDGLLDMLSGHAGGNIYHYEQTAEDGFDFGDINVSSVSAAEKYLVKAFDLNSDLTITAPDGFTVSGSESGSFGSLVIIPESEMSADTIYVRFEPSQAVSYTGNVTHSTADMTDILLPVSGTGILGIPQNISAEISGTELILSWDAVTGASGYKVYSCDDPYGDFTEEITAPVGETWTVEYTEAKKFYYVVALYGAKDTGTSNKIEVKKNSLGTRN